jgi:hypothetical protein
LRAASSLNANRGIPPCRRQLEVGATAGGSRNIGVELKKMIENPTNGAIDHERERGRRTQITDVEPVFCTRREAARLLRASVSSLERWSKNKIGPRFVLVAGKALYERAELLRFAREGR